MGKKLGNKIFLKDLIRIKKIFDDQGWSIDEEDGSVFSKFCTRAQSLPSDDCRDLFYELTERYCKISDSQYLELLIKSVERAFEDYPEISGSKTIYIRQLLCPDDFDARKVKSSARVWYTFADADLRDGRALRKYWVDLHEELSEYDICQVNNGEACIFLVDDYVGTGDTAIKAIGPLLERQICQDRIIILSVAAQQTGVERLRNQGIKVSASVIRKKGITDYYSPEEVKKKIRIMNRIEKFLEVEQKFQLGYGESEGLITLVKTPNNTFPLYWYGPSRDCSAPFYRGK